MTQTIQPRKPRGARTGGQFANKDHSAPEATLSERKAERAAQAADLHRQLAEQVETLQTSEGWQAMLDTAAKFHRYSFNNVMLIHMQKPDATRVAGYRVWQGLGRQVRKGEKGIKILGFGQIKVNKDDPEDDRTRTVFPTLSVFDISQTDPIEGVEDQTVALAANQIALDITDDPAQITDKVADWAARQGWTFEYGDTASARGYSDPATKTIRIRAGQTPAETAAVALHEAAHVHAGHCADDADDYATHRGRMEVEAEATAYIVASMLGHDTNGWSTGYVAGWARRDPDAMKSSAKHIVKTAHTLFAELTGE